MKNRTVQLIFQSFYCALAVVAAVASVGFFDMIFRWDFYIYFTNISSYLCFIIGFIELWQTARKKEDSFVTVLPLLKFITMLGTILTFLVFNLLLANDPNRDPAENYKVACVLCHIVLPIMYTADWLLFYERGNVQKTWPALSALFPLSYLLFVFIHGAVLRFDSTILNYTGSDPLIFPYFFLNPARVGFGGVLLWCVMLLAAFLAGGFIFMAVDHLLKKIIR